MEKELKQKQGLKITQYSLQERSQRHRYTEKEIKKRRTSEGQETKPQKTVYELRTDADGHGLAHREGGAKLYKPRPFYSNFLSCCLVRWIINSTAAQSTEDAEAELELAMVRHQPEGLEKLQTQTKFTRKELQSLYRGFKHECPHGLVNEETFKIIYSKFFPQGDAMTYAHFLFNAFDMERNGSIRFEDFVMGLSVLLRGSVREKLHWAFNLYDINKDGFITREEMLVVIKSIYDMMGRFTSPRLRAEAPYEHVERFFQKMDRNRDGIVTLDEFIETCQKDEDVIASMYLFDNVL